MGESVSFCGVTCSAKKKRASECEQRTPTWFKDRFMIFHACLKTSGAQMNIETQLKMSFLVAVAGKGWKY